MNASKTTAVAAIAGLAAVLAAAAPKRTTSIDEAQPGYREVALPMETHQLGHLKPGHRVDVLVTFDALLPDKSREAVTATLLQDVEVLGVDDGKVVRLLLNQGETQYAVLSVAPDRRLWLARRGLNDKGLKPMEMATYRKLFK